jgi:hypothetical protein
MKKRGVHEIKMSQTQFWLDGSSLPLSFFGWLNHSDSQQLLFEKFLHKQCRVVLLEDLCYPETSKYCGYFSFTRFRCTPEMRLKIQSVFEKSNYEILSWVYVRRTWLDVGEGMAKYWFKFTIIICILLAVVAYGAVAWTQNQLKQKIEVLETSLQNEKEKNKSYLAKRPLDWKKSNQALFYSASQWSHAPSQLRRLWVGHQTIELSGYCSELNCDSVQRFVEEKLAFEKSPLTFELGAVTPLGRVWELQDRQ